MKAILVVDIPDYDDVSKLGVMYIVSNQRGQVVKSNMIIKPCLRPMPMKKDTVRDEPYSIEDYRIGWNACIDEILGETE